MRHKRCFTMQERSLVVLNEVLFKLREHEGDASVRPPLVLTYVNRLSDWLFVMSRWITAVLGEEEMLWQPLGKRGKEDGIAASILRQAEHDADFDTSNSKTSPSSRLCRTTSRVSSCVNWAIACSQSSHKWSRCSWESVTSSESVFC